MLQDKVIVLVAVTYKSVIRPIVTCGIFLVCIFSRFEGTAPETSEADYLGQTEMRFSISKITFI